MKNITEEIEAPNNSLVHQREQLRGVVDLTDMQLCTGDNTITPQPAGGHLWAAETLHTADSHGTELYER